MSAELFERLQKELVSLDEVSSLSMTAVFMLPKALTKLLSWIIRKKRVQIEDIAAYFEQHVETVQPVIDSLVTKKYLERADELGETYFQVSLGNQRSRPAHPRNDP
jgi:hypothetical protein